MKTMCCFRGSESNSEVVRCGRGLMGSLAKTCVKTEGYISLGRVGVDLLFVLQGSHRS